MTGAATRSARGYTIVELMMALTVLAIGVGGIVSMQKVAMASNRHAKNLAIGTRIGQTWLDHLTADAAQWRSSDALQFASARFLRAPDTTGWFVPAEPITGYGLGAGFDANGTFVATGAEHFCVHLRLSELHQEATPVVGGGLIRTEVRVFWFRLDTPLGVPRPAVTPCNVPVADVTSEAPNPVVLDQLYFSNTVRQHVPAL